MSRRFHAEVLLQVAEDLALENVTGQFDEEQNADNMTQFVGPMMWTLAAGATATQVNFPAGATKLRMVSIMKVDSAEGLNVHYDAIDADATLVVPPVGTNMEGQYYATVSADSFYLSNPSSTTSVSFSMLLGFGPS